MKRKRSLQPSHWRFKFWMLLLDIRDWWRGGPPKSGGMMID